MVSVSDDHVVLVTCDMLENISDLKIFLNVSTGH